MPVFEYEAKALEIDPVEQIKVLTFHKIRIFEEIQWWNSNLKSIDWINESPFVLRDLLYKFKKFFLDIEFPPNDISLGFNTSHVSSK